MLLEDTEATRRHLEQELQRSGRTAGLNLKALETNGDMREDCSSDAAQAGLEGRLEAAGEEQARGGRGEMVMMAVDWTTGTEDPSTRRLLHDLEGTCPGPAAPVVDEGDHGH